LLIELSFEARWSWSSTQAVCQIASRARWMSMALSASMNDTPSCVPAFVLSDEQCLCYELLLRWSQPG
jgi:hypothetical protein